MTQCRLSVGPGKAHAFAPDTTRLTSCIPQKQGRAAIDSVPRFKPSEAKSDGTFRVAQVNRTEGAGSRQETQAF